MAELKKMSYMVGAMLTKEEMNDFMAEADKEILFIGLDMNYTTN